MRRRLLQTLMGLFLFATPLFAQTYELPEGKATPPDKSVAKEWLIGSVFLIGCLVVAFKPAKRANLR